MEPDSKGTSIREKKNNTRSKDTTDKAARQGRMEGKQLQTLFRMGAKSGDFSITAESCHT